MIFILLGVVTGFTVFYTIKSVKDSKKDSLKNKAYRDAVNENVIKGGGKLKSNYDINMEGNNNFRYLVLEEQE